MSCSQLLFRDKDNKKTFYDDTESFETLQAATGIKCKKSQDKKLYLSYNVDFLIMVVLIRLGKENNGRDFTKVKKGMKEYFDRLYEKIIDDGIYNQQHTRKKKDETITQESNVSLFHMLFNYFLAFLILYISKTGLEAVQNEGNGPVQQQPVPISSNVSSKTSENQSKSKLPSDEVDHADEEDGEGMGNDGGGIGVNDEKIWPFYEDLMETKRKQESGI